jgi:hypothetical protein
VGRGKHATYFGFIFFSGMGTEVVDWRGFDAVMKGIFFILRACWGLDRKKQDAWFGV